MRRAGFYFFRSVVAWVEWLYKDWWRGAVVVRTGRAVVGAVRVPMLLLANCLNDNGAALMGRVLSGGHNVGFTIVIGSVNRIGVSTSLVRGNNIIKGGRRDLMTLRGNYVYYALGASLVRRVFRVVGVRHFSCVIVRTDNVYRPRPVTRALYSVPRVKKTCAGCNVYHLSYVAAMISTLHLRDRFSYKSSLAHGNVSRRSVRGLVVRRVRFYGVVLLGGTTRMRPRRLGHVGRVVHALRPNTRVVRYGCTSMSLSGVVRARLFGFRHTTASTK